MLIIHRIEKKISLANSFDEMYKSPDNKTTNGTVESGLMIVNFGFSNEIHAFTLILKQVVS